MREEIASLNLAVLLLWPCTLLVTTSHTLAIGSNLCDLKYVQASKRDHSLAITAHLLEIRCVHGILRKDI